MNLQSVYCGFYSCNFIGMESPGSFRYTHTIFVFKLSDLIPLLWLYISSWFIVIIFVIIHSNGYCILSLVNTFEMVFDCIDWIAIFYIDVTLILFVIWDNINIAVFDKFSVFKLLKDITTLVIRNPTIERISIFWHFSLWLVFLWKIVFTKYIFHTL